MASPIIKLIKCDNRVLNISAILWQETKLRLGSIREMSQQLEQHEVFSSASTSILPGPGVDCRHVYVFYIIAVKTAMMIK